MSEEKSERWVVFPRGGGVHVARVLSMTPRCICFSRFGRREGRVHPSAIYALTDTSAQANDLRSRIIQEISEHMRRVEKIVQRFNMKTPPPAPLPGDTP